MVKTQFTEIKRRGKDKPVNKLSLEEVKSVIRQKIINIRNQRHYAIKQLCNFYT